MCIVELISTGDGQIMETDNIGIKLCWLHFKNISCIFCYSFVCLCCAVPVSVNYRLCLVTVCVRVLQNGRLLRFSKRSYCWCMFSWSICNKTATLLGVSRAAVSKVMMTYILIWAAVSSILLVLYLV